MGNYKASKVLGEGRKSWSIIFRHPVKKDYKGKVGLRIRRGLGTTDEKQADNLVNQMNEILSTPSLWDVRAKDTVMCKYDPKIVAAFYDALEPKALSYQDIRDTHIPLPNTEQGYANILLVGTTGAGKTTLLRQLIGTDPKKDRFPSTSPNKTTVSDIEVICSEGTYKAVVTFFDYREVRIHVEDCVMAAVFANLKQEEESSIAQRLLEHEEQRFRFFYTLGEYDLDMDEEEYEELISSASGEVVSLEEKRQFTNVIRSNLKEINELAKISNKILESMGTEPNAEYTDLPPIEKVKFEELLDEELRQDSQFHMLVDHMMDEMATRFEELSSGEIQQRNGDWPLVWTFSSDNRNQFLEKVRKFASNYAPNFGKLLTPLVQGIRVQGPFKPSWSESVPRLVFIDGQGLGHTTSSSTSIPSQMLRKFDTSDSIVLVDSAKHPMQAAPLAVLRSIVASGHTSKLNICFSHMDELNGDNLLTRKSKLNHIKASLNQATRYIRDKLDAESASNVEMILLKQTYFLSNLDQVVTEDNKYTLTELTNLISNLERSIYNIEDSDVIPHYDEANLVFAIQTAMKDFHELWDIRLGFKTSTSESKKHWKTIQALTRRLALDLDDGEFSGLRPVPELWGFLIDQIRVYLASPVRWVPTTAEGEDKQIAVNKIAKEIHTHLLDYCSERLWKSRLTPWNFAFELKGVGSGNKRMKEMKDIYDNAAPIPGETATTDTHELLLEIRKLVKKAIIAKGGRMISTN
ncbi:hypothetical protein N0O92_18170 [Alkalihalobacillus sp. MEB130]|uniref:hypothetical protein n=1 Tax=Alkalihalobacillus sp. MEB130 TaxID=2976704 RepID=UPI0028E089E5|nr:hypothetical protein [Alkalihalobacillus sp. MEB130]MDT8862141.1 hypothetical protein [Alkalihalobacillus sp. MEB130]